MSEEAESDLDWNVAFAVGYAVGLAHGHSIADAIGNALGIFVCSMLVFWLARVIKRRFARRAAEVL